MSIFKNKEKVVLIGDSITDNGRREDPAGIGWGYVRVIRDYVHIHHPHLQLEWINQGISGNRVVDLRERWQTDVLDVRPDWVSISIGINDVWRQLDHKAPPVYIDEFIDYYRGLLELTRQETDARLILMETSIIGEEVDAEGNVLLEPYNEAIRTFAAEFDAQLVPIRDVFLNDLRRPDRLPLTTDGVHMTSTGDMLMAMTWLKACQLSTVHP